MTLFASALTLIVLKQLIKPIEVASKALRNYKKEKTSSIYLQDILMRLFDEEYPRDHNSARAIHKRKARSSLFVIS
jgi:hypothetical protein